MRTSAVNENNTFERERGISLGEVRGCETLEKEDYKKNIIRVEMCVSARYFSFPYLNIMTNFYALIQKAIWKLYIRKKLVLKKRFI